MLHPAQDRSAPGTPLPRPRGAAARFAGGPVRTLPALMEDLAAILGAAPALAGPDGSLTYAELGGALARTARWALAQGFRPGDTIALLMPENLGRHTLWLGLARAGLRVALIDPGLSGARLARCLASAGPRLLVADPACAAALATLSGLAVEMPAVGWHGAGADVARVDLEIAEYDGAALGLRCAPEPAPDAPALLACAPARDGGTLILPASHAALLAWAQGFADAAAGLRRPDCPPAFRTLAEACGTLLRGAPARLGPVPALC